MKLNAHMIHRSLCIRVGQDMSCVVRLVFIDPDFLDVTIRGQTTEKSFYLLS